MNQREIAGLMAAIAPTIGDFVGKAMAPLRVENERLALNLATVEKQFNELFVARENDKVFFIGLIKEEVAKVDLTIDPEVVDRVVTEKMDKAVSEMPVPVDGKDGEDADPELMAVLVAEQVEKAFAAIDPPKDGKDGASVAVDDVLPVLEEMVAKRFDALPVPKDGNDGVDGRDGISVTLEELEPKILTAAQKAVDALPKMPTSMLIDGDGDLVAIYPAGPKPIGKVRGEDGARGASIMDGEVDEYGHLMLRMSDGRQVRTGKVKGDAGTPGEDGRPGDRGRDAHEIQILPGVDETRSYAAGVCACWRGGIIRAERQTDPIIDDDIMGAGWIVYLNGVADEAETVVGDGREIERVTTYTNGKSFTRRHKTATVLDKGVWKEGGYSKGDGVTWAGSFHIAQRDTTDKPETSDAWRLAVKRGRNGSDGKIPPPRNGPVKL